MPPTTPSRDTLFCEAIEIANAAERAAHVARVCGADAKLRRQVEDLVAAHFNAGSFLEQPVDALNVTAIYAPASGSEEAVSWIGPYKLLERIGEGGMGTVFMADQTQPVRRRVALKVIKPGMDSSQVIARFEAERQALALMDHPNIAKVLDAGATEAGRPYFAMELVRGLPITEYCDKAPLSIPDRLGIFVQVCRAVQHAHQKGIIHRDIKPSNVLVTVIDGLPVPKVIDFGIAKATGGALTDRTLFTGFHQMVGTPMYMSPEQADLSGVDVDTRADVYALGVLLYELLTGSTPFDTETFRKAGLDEVRRIIREEEPRRPSQMVSTLASEKVSTVADRRKIDPRKLGSMMRNELDWVVMRALDKDRNRRYESASALAADVERYLTDEPVLACPPSAGYRLRKFARRNRTGMAAALILFVGFSTVVGSMGWVMHERTTRVSTAEQRANEILQEAEELGRQGRWPEAMASLKRVEAVLGSEGREELKQVVRRRLAEIEFVVRLQAIRLEIAAIENESFDYQRGDALYAEAFRDFGLDVDSLSPSELAERMPGAPVREEVVAALDNWVDWRRDVNKGDDRPWNRVLAATSAADSDPWRNRVREAWGRKFSKGELTQVELMESVPFEKLSPSSVLLLVGRIGHPWSQNSVALLRKAQQRWPADFWLNHTLACWLISVKPVNHLEALGFFRAALALRPESPGVLSNLAITLMELGRFDEAIAATNEAIRLKPDYANAHNTLGNALFKKGLRKEAAASYREAIRLRPLIADYHRNLGNALYNLGDSRFWDEAESALRESIRLRPFGSDGYNKLGYLLKSKGTVEEAEAMFRKAIKFNPRNVEAHVGLGGLLCDFKQDYDGAIAEFQRVLELNPEHSKVLYNLGKALIGKDDYQNAIIWFRKAISRNPNDYASYYGLGLALDQLGDQPGSIRAYREVVRVKPDYSEAWYNLGNVHLSRGEFVEAIGPFRQVIRLLPDFPEAHCNLGHALRQTGKFREALPFLKRGHELGSKNPRWSFPSATWVRDCQRLIAMDDWLRKIAADAVRLLGIEPGNRETLPAPKGAG